MNHERTYPIPTVQIGLAVKFGGRVLNSTERMFARVAIPKVPEPIVPTDVPAFLRRQAS